MQIGARYAGRRAYMLVDSDEPKEEKQTQTDLAIAARTRFVTPRPVLSNEEAAASSLAQAFRDLRERIRAPKLKNSLLIVLGHDPDKRRDEVDRRIGEDAAAEALDGQLRDFFDAVLAPVMQERETALVGTIQDCIQHELQSQQFIVHNQEKRIALLTQQVENGEKQVAHLKAKVDRRVNENNALRKEQYRQLLMLRDIVSKQSSEPGALSALNEAIATVLAAKQEKLESETPRNGGDSDQNKASGRGGGSANTQVLHREKEKWEHRAREASAECQELRDKIAHLTQENNKYRASMEDPWFLNSENAIAERQRIAEAVCASQGSWDDVGDSLVELLNNDILWAAVEKSARRGGTQRVARGLEAVFAQLDGLSPPPSIDDDDSENDEAAANPPPRRRSAYADVGRLIPCRVCNGAGYIQTDLGENATNDADAYLRKTLEQVLELKKLLENANTKVLTMEGKLEMAQTETAELQEIVRQAELIKSSAVDVCLQADLDTEEGIDIDEIMQSAYGDGTPSGQPSMRRNHRNSQYEHLIVELKSTLADKDEGLAESRKALDVAHARAVTLQRALQKEKDAHAQELGMLKTTLAFSLKTRNTKIEERQAAVKLLLKKFSKKHQPLTISEDIPALSPMDETGGEGSDGDGADESVNESGGAERNLTSTELNNEQPEVRRMENLVQRYAEDIIRVRKEHEIQQELLKKAEAQIAEEDEKRSRTNSISQGSIVVNLASHPRDLFKALSTAQSDMMKLRRASHRASALQTDRLLTLTTHLGHMSEELCTLRKRNLAELEFWKLECEKLQNTNKALEAELQLNQQQLQAARQIENVEDESSKTCWMCEKHKTRLVSISNQLLIQAQTARTDPEREVPAPSTLTDSERKSISSVLLDLESLYSGMTVSKMQLARELVATHLGNELSPRSTRSANARSSFQDGSRNDNTAVPRISSISPRRATVGVKSSKSKSQLKKSAESSATQPQLSESPTRMNQTAPVPPNGSEQVSGLVSTNSDTSGQATRAEGFSPSHRRKTVVIEIFGDGEVLPTNQGLQVNTLSAETPIVEIPSEKSGDNNAEMRTHNLALGSSDIFTGPLKGSEPQGAPGLESEVDWLNSEEDGLQSEEDLFYETGIPLLDSSNNIERDPEVIEQLRLLINQNTATKHNFAITGWKLLVCRILCLWNQQRLDRMKKIADKRTKIQSNGKELRVESRKSTCMRDTMQKRVQLREKAVQNATSDLEILRKERKKAQAHLIHSVSTLLTNLSRRTKSMTPPKWQTDEQREVLYIPQPGSPRRSPTNNRSLYPSAKVHMNHLPPTQHIPTSTFPTLTSRSPSPSLSPGQQARPSSSLSRDKPSEGLPSNETYQLPHRLIKSAGPRNIPFLPIHSTIGKLQGSIPFPDPARIRELRETGGDAMNWDSPQGPSRPARPHSSPAGPRYASPRTQELKSSASALDNAATPTTESGQFQVAGLEMGTVSSLPAWGSS